MVTLRRRTVLAAGAGVALAACTSAPETPAAAPTTPPPSDPLLAELADERALLGAYDAAIARHPSLRTRLAGPRADHADHVDRLAAELGTAPATGAGTGTAGPSGSGGPGAASPSGSGGPGAAGPAAPATPAAAVAALKAAERAAASARGTAALSAEPHRAELLAGISACEATHLVVLG